MLTCVPFTYSSTHSLTLECHVLSLQSHTPSFPYSGAFNAYMRDRISCQCYPIIETGKRLLKSTACLFTLGLSCPYLSMEGFIHFEEMNETNTSLTVQCYLAR